MTVLRNAGRTAHPRNLHIDIAAGVPQREAVILPDQQAAAIGMLGPKGRADRKVPAPAGLGRTFQPRTIRLHAGQGELAAVLNAHFISSQMDRLMSCSPAKGFRTACTILAGDARRPCSSLSPTSMPPA